MTNGHSSAQKHRTKWLSDTGRLPFWKTYTKRIPRTRPERSAALRESSGFKEPRGRVHDVENPWTTLCVLPAALSPITDQNSGQRNVFYVPSSFGRKRKKGNIYVYIHIRVSPLLWWVCIRNERMSTTYRGLHTHFYSETCFSFFLPARCICIFLDLRVQRMATRPCTYIRISNSEDASGEIRTVATHFFFHQKFLCLSQISPPFAGITLIPI